MSGQHSLKLSKEQREQMVSAIRAYFLNERDEELGDLAAGFILDFFVQELAPHFYDQGVSDSYLYLSDRLGDLLSIQFGPKNTRSFDK